MVEQIIRYKAADGSIWATEDQATERELVISKVQLAMKLLGPDQELGNYEYFQHKTYDADAAKVAMIGLFNYLFPSYAVNDPPHKINPRTSIIGRVACDSESPFCDGWIRLMSIDFSTGREYNQPYFAGHPDETTKFTCVNP